MLEAWDSMEWWDSMELRDDWEEDLDRSWMVWLRDASSLKASTRWWDG